MSQGRKETPEPSVFVNAADLYRSLPRSQFYERLAQVLELDFVYALTQPLYAPKMGRPSLDPVVFFKCMLIGFFENILSDTELEYRIADSLTLRRFLGYSLAERTPDESTLRKTRHRMPEEAFRAVFARVLDQCQAAGLLQGRVIGTDSTLVDANASMDSCATRRWAVPMRSTSWRCGARISPPPPGKRPPPTIGSGGAARRATRTGRARRTRTPG